MPALHQLRCSRLLHLVLALVVWTLVAASLAAGRAAAATNEYEGVMVHSLWYQDSTADLDHELDLAAATHANVVRVDVGWVGVEPDASGQQEPGYLAKLDRFVADANARGLKVLPVVFSTPCWASSAPAALKHNCQGNWWVDGANNYPPSNPLDYAHFIAWMVSRYGSGLAAVELWNEPNADGNPWWKGTPTDYANLVKATYPVAKAANPNVPILAGALSGGDAAYLNQLYAAGIKGSYDGIAVHPYNGAQAPDAPCPVQYQKYCTVAGIQAIRSAEATAGDSAPIWVTEFGWTTDGGQVSEAQKAAWIPQALSLLRGMPDVKSAVAFAERAMGDSVNNDGFALVNNDYSPRASYPAVAAAMATRGAPSTGSTGSGSTGSGSTGSGSTGSGSTGSGSTGSAPVPVTPSPSVPATTASSPSTTPGVAAPAPSPAATAPSSASPASSATVSSVSRPRPRGHAVARARSGHPRARVAKVRRARMARRATARH